MGERRPGDLSSSRRALEETTTGGVIKIPKKKDSVAMGSMFKSMVKANATIAVVTQLFDKLQQISPYTQPITDFFDRFFAGLEAGYAERATEFVKVLWSDDNIRIQDDMIKLLTSQKEGHDILIKAMERQTELLVLMGNSWNTVAKAMEDVVNLIGAQKAGGTES